MNNQVWYILFSVVLVLIVGIIRLVFRDQLANAFGSFCSNYQAHRNFKGGTIVYSQFNILASILYFLALGFMFYRINDFFNIIVLWGDMTTYIIVAVSLIIFTYFKIILYLLFGFFIDGYEVTREFVYNWVTINHISGFVFVPIAISLAFVNLKLFPYFIWVGLGFLIFFNIYRLIRGLKIIFQENFPLYYILLYLCTLEFLPIFAMWHLLGK